ncbi:50S ribosomal protein L19e [Candidatus Woesearchaeota archaeon]|nr:50S ribosomal protein L19e [Candidatus Woesearchaeota archaeon]
MKLDIQKKLAASLKDVSKKRVKIDLDRLKDIEMSIDDLKQSITKDDVRKFIKDKVILILPKRGISRGRARKTKEQKKKGRRKGDGSRSGTPKARLSKKKRWMNKVRPQRKLLKELRDKKMIESKDYRT